MTKWPAPIIKLYLGQFTPAAVLAAVDEQTGRTKKRQTCQANFYGGVWALRQGAKEEAARLFQLAADGCYKSAIEWRAAMAELKALELASTVAPSAPPAEAAPPDVAPSDVAPKDK